ncbi:hypothetical protein DID88_000993 [Monilinia fructigena]|uniref:EIF3F/CSN6-like C-terminal domain-containing protein n=1 Tax=Monilinia fructigena TaxID=38457 RepID=A0A395IZK1_9HELO|nr:hypothetical protein DID88_000993 [Monilinia fructigena]
MRFEYSESEKSGLELISGAKDSESRAAPTLDLLERVSEYVSSVLDEEREPSNALGQFLMNALSLAPKVDAQDIERDFNNHIQDVLVVSYLANTIRTQIDLSQRLATATLTMGGSDVLASTGSGERREGRAWTWTERRQAWRQRRRQRRRTRTRAKGSQESQERAQGTFRVVDDDKNKAFP